MPKVPKFLSRCSEAFRVLLGLGDAFHDCSGELIVQQAEIRLVWEQDNLENYGAVSLRFFEGNLL